MPAEQVIGGAKQTGVRPLVQQAVPSQVPVRDPLVHRSPTLHAGGGGGEQVIGGAKQTGNRSVVQQAVPSQAPVKDPLVHLSPTLQEGGVEELLPEPVPDPEPPPPDKMHAVLEPLGTYPGAHSHKFKPAGRVRLVPQGLAIMQLVPPGRPVVGKVRTPQVYDPAPE